jgi:DNA-binding NtrC family response regulator
MVDLISDHDIATLITGEIGTGKELIANTLHHLSPRRSYPFIQITCPPLSQSLLDSNFSDLETRALIEKLKLADNGTLFLEEIGNMGLKAQWELIRFIEHKERKKANIDRSAHYNVRIIASTSGDLANGVIVGTFREDLYYFLNPITISIPPLRSRKGDIPLMAKYYMKEFSKQMGKRVKEISPETLELLIDYDWPGNIRELKNIIERAVILGKREMIYPQDLPKDIQNETPLVTMARLEKQQIIAALKGTGGNKSKAASLLNIARTTLYNKIKEMAIG